MSGGYNSMIRRPPAKRRAARRAPSLPQYHLPVTILGVTYQTPKRTKELSPPLLPVTILGITYRNRASALLLTPYPLQIRILLTWLRVANYKASIATLPEP